MDFILFLDWGSSEHSFFVILFPLTIAVSYVEKIIKFVDGTLYFIMSLSNLDQKSMKREKACEASGLLRLGGPFSTSTLILLFKPFTHYVST
jgi:hypothetical protein